MAVSERQVVTSVGEGEGVEDKSPPTLRVGM